MSTLFMLALIYCIYFIFFFQAEDGIRDVAVTGVQTCALPISCRRLEKGVMGEKPTFLPLGFLTSLLLACYTQEQKPSRSQPCLKLQKPPPKARLAPSPTPWDRSKSPPTAITARKPPARLFTSLLARTLCRPS